MIFTFIRTMRPARYVGPAGKERFWAFAWFGLVRVGLGWVSGWDSGWDCARGIFPPESALPDPLNYYNTPQAKCDVHRIDVNAINNEKRTVAVYRILGICDVHRIWDRMRRTSHMTLMRCTSCCSNLRMYMRYVKWDVYAIVEDRCICH